MDPEEFDDEVLATEVSVRREAFTPDFTALFVDFSFNVDEEVCVLSVQRSFDDDDGVCLVFTPSEQCAYDAFTSLELTRSALSMRFNEDGREAFEVGSLRVEFTVDDELFGRLAEMLATICAGKPFFSPLPKA